MDTNQGSRRRRSGRAFAALLATIAATLIAATSGLAQGQNTGGSKPRMAAADTPDSVLLFPAVISAPDGSAPTEPTAANRMVQEIVTDALRRQLNRSGIGVVVYDRRLPSVQRAVSEGLKPEDAATGPGDDPRKAQRFADIAGATEYLTVSVDNYKFDTTSRTATFNLSVFRNTSTDAAPLGTSAHKGQGIAPADVAAPRQEGSAAARAAEVAAEQVVADLYPPVVMAAGPAKPVHRRGAAEKFVLPAFGIALGLLFFSTR